MKRKAVWLLVSCLVILSMVASSCNPAPTEVTQEKWQWPKGIVIGTPAVGTASHAQTVALAPLLEKATGMTVRVIPEDVEAVRFKRFGEGEFDIIAMSISELDYAVAGIGGYSDKPKFAVRALWHQNDTPWGFAVLGDSPLNSIYDIKNKPGIKIGNNNASPAMTDTVKLGLTAFLGITEKDITIVPFGGYTESVRSISEGKAEVALIAPTSAVTYEIAGSPQGIKYLDMPLTDKEGWKRFLAVRPTAIPAELTWGVKAALGHFGYTSNYIYWVREDTDPQLVYNLAKWLDENYNSYKDAHEACARMDMKTWRAFLNYNPAPVASGTVKYMKEVNQWTAKDDIWNKTADEVVDKYIKAWKDATAEAASKSVKVSSEDKSWLAIWSAKVTGIPRLAARIE